MEPPCFDPPAVLPRAHPRIALGGRIKRRAEDFRVDELLDVAPEGEGGHAWLRLAKRDVNTQWLARELARGARVRPADVSYAGLKDRRALATQWFSVRLDARPDPDWRALLPHGVELLEATRHRRKLRPGALAGNRFDIVVSGARGDLAAAPGRCAELARDGVPNYFGAQRFGRDAGNVIRAWAVLIGGERVRDRRLRGIYLSAARALLFNRVLARRVAAGTWQRALAGECLMLAGSHSIFTAHSPDADIEARLKALDVHPTGPLCGRGTPPASAAAAAAEAEALTGCGEWIEGLQRAGLEHARRALRVVPGEARAEAGAGDTLRVAFTLPPGAYATMVLRELGDVEDGEGGA
ncbi:MAG: tRNA pseudouridine(13) synthase TruD [Burkholderiales bacterium]|nr:tRNA pseudouridine(13) synthase TruD [Burkholderiales bacterium]